MEKTALNSIAKGNRSYGTIASDTGMGATCAYKTVERLLAKGHISIHENGMLKLSYQKQEGEYE